MRSNLKIRFAKGYEHVCTVYCDYWQEDKYNVTCFLNYELIVRIEKDSFNKMEVKLNDWKTSDEKEVKLGNFSFACDKEEKDRTLTLDE